jgi:hypothetical protein
MNETATFPTVDGSGDNAGGVKPVIEQGAPSLPGNAAAKTSAPVTIPPRRAGRHKSDCACAVCMSKRGQVVGNARRRADIPPAGGEPVDPLVVKEIAGFAVGIVNDLVVRSTEKLAAVASGNDDATVKKFGEMVAMSDTEETTIVEASARLAEKYNIAAKYSLEALFLLAIGSYGFRAYRVQSQLAKIIVANRRTQTAHAAEHTPPGAPPSAVAVTP